MAMEIDRLCILIDHWENAPMYDQLCVSKIFFSKDLPFMWIFQIVFNWKNFSLNKDSIKWTLLVSPISYL